MGIRNRIVLNFNVICNISNNARFVSHVQRKGKGLQFSSLWYNAKLLNYVPPIPSSR